MSIFSGIGGVATPNASRGEWFRPGEYLARIDRIIGKNRREDGQPTLIVELTILQVIVGNDASNKPGTKASWIKVLKRKLNGELTDDGVRDMGRVKAFIGAALGGVDPEAITEEVADTVLADDGTALSGTVLKVRVSESTSAKTGKTYTNVDFYPGDEA